MHFLVIAVGPDWKRDLEQYAAHSDQPLSRLEFVDTGEDNRQEYATGYRDQLILADGRQMSVFSAEARVFRRALLPDECALGPKEIRRRFIVFEWSGNGVTVLAPPPGSVVRRVPLREMYATFEAFMVGKNQAPDPHTGRYGYWRNPWAKWDWYVVGGRWHGFFVPKPGLGGRIGEPDSFGTPRLPGGVDQVRRDAVDFDHMEAEAHAEALASWDALDALVPPGLFDGLQTLTALLARHAGDDFPTANARDTYDDQPAVVAFKRLLIEAGEAGRRFLGMAAEEARDRLAMGRMPYAEEQSRGAWVPRAILLNGQWHERAGEDRAGWVVSARATLAGLPGASMLTALDCHY